MKTLREKIVPFVTETIEHYSKLCEKDGVDTVIEGVRVLDAKAEFVHGTLVNSTIHLYLIYKNEGNPEAENVLERLIKFIKIAESVPCETWGKLAILRGLLLLHKNGLLSVIPEDDLSILKKITEYDDFYDKETGELIRKPTNYYQVAFACAGIRELLGWDHEGTSKIIEEKLFSIMAGGSESGWMDENPPYKRFDRYSILVTSELSDTLSLIGEELPDSAKENLKEAAKMMLFMANGRGDGINYGRSLSCHGDGAAAEILSSACARGLLDETEKDAALAYSSKIVDKILGFWYDRDRHSLNIWWDGRTTNAYRRVARLLEVNLDMAHHLLTTLENFEKAGLADKVPDASVRVPEKWEVFPARFSNTEKAVAETEILRRGDLLVMLPFIGLGNLYRNAAYMPYPAICGYEGSPEAKHPFLVPEYTDENGKLYRPIQFYDSVTTEQNGDTVTFRANGRLAEMGGGYPVDSGIPFSAEFVFDALSVTARFSTDLDFLSAKMLIGTHKDGQSIEPFGFSRAEDVDPSGDPDFFTPSGAITKASLCYADRTKESLGYVMDLTFA